MKFEVPEDIIIRPPRASFIKYGRLYHRFLKKYIELNFSVHDLTLEFINGFRKACLEDAKEYRGFEIHQIPL